MIYIPGPARTADGDGYYSIDQESTGDINQAFWMGLGLGSSIKDNVACSSLTLLTEAVRLLSFVREAGFSSRAAQASASHRRHHSTGVTPHTRRCSLTPALTSREARARASLSKGPLSKRYAGGRIGRLARPRNSYARAVKYLPISNLD